MQLPTRFLASVALPQYISRKCVFFPTIFTKNCYFSSLPPSDDALVSAAVEILKHQRSKSRWSYLRHLTAANDLTPAQFSRIALQIRNNARLALNFFNFTVRHSVCSHSLFSYATIIHILSRSRLRTEAQSVIQSAFRKFPDSNQPNSSTPLPIFKTLIETYRTCDSAPFVFDLLVKACLESKKVDQALEIFRLLKSKSVFLKVSTFNRLIEMVMKTRGCYEGYDVFKEMLYCDNQKCSDNGGRIKGLHPNVNTFNVVMIGFLREGLVEKVEEMWQEMDSLNCLPNAYSYSILMASYCEDGRMEDAMRVWEKMQCKGVERDAVAYNTIIGGFCGVGEIERAEEIYRGMVMSGVESTSLTFEHLINGYCQIGDVDSVMMLYKDMRQRGFNPESSTVNAVMRVLCDKGELSKALEFLWNAKQSVILKRTYEVLIKSLCQEGRMEEALKLQADMVGKGYEPDSEIYGIFIDGYMRQGNDAMAHNLRQEMLEKTMTEENR